MKKDMICVIYVDDTIVAGPDADALEEMIKSLGIVGEGQRHIFELLDEGEVCDFRVSELKRLVPRNLLLFKLA